MPTLMVSCATADPPRIIGASAKEATPDAALAISERFVNDMR
jgi:hypothetical protein